MTHPTSVVGIRRMIGRKHRAGKSVPRRMVDALEEAVRQNPEKAFSKRGIDPKLINPKKRAPTYRVDHGTTLGKASPGRKLDGEELEARKRDLER